MTPTEMLDRLKAIRERWVGIHYPQDDIRALSLAIEILERHIAMLPKAKEKTHG